MAKKNNNNIEITEERVEILVDDLKKYFSNIEKTSLNLLHQKKITKETFRERALNYLVYDKRNDAEIAKVAVSEFERYTFGYNILDELINDEDISDIRIVSENNIRVKRLGKRESTNIKFKSREEYIKFVDFIAAKNKVNLSSLNASQIFTDKESNEKFILRFAISTGFLNSTDAPYVHIRKIAKNKKTLDTLIKEKMLNNEIKQYLIEKAKNGTGILFTGKGASGKTTLMNALLDEAEGSALVIQESEELFSYTQPEFMFQHVIQNRGESKIEYSLKDLAKAGLLMDLDYFLIGEIKGEEARYFLNAAYTGHKCWASVHGMNSVDAMDKLADYIKDATDYNKTEIMKMLRYISTIIYMENYRVKEISEVVGWDKENKELIFKRIF